MLCAANNKPHKIKKNKLIENKEKQKHSTHFIKITAKQNKKGNNEQTNQ